MAGIWSDCKKFVNEHICECLWGIIAAGIALATSLMLTVQQLSMSTTTTELIARTTSATLDENTKVQRETNQAILKELGTLSINVAVLAERSKGAETRPATTPNPSPFVPRIAGEPTP